MKMASNDKTIGPAIKPSPLENKLISNKGPTNAEFTLKENKHVGKMILRGSLSEKNLSPLQRIIYHNNFRHPQTHFMTTPRFVSFGWDQTSGSS